MKSSKIGLVYFFAGFPPNELYIQMVKWCLTSINAAAEVTLYIVALNEYEKWQNLIEVNNFKNIVIVDYKLNDFLNDCNKQFDLELKYEYGNKRANVLFGKKFLCSFKPFNLIMLYDKLKDHEYIGYTEWDNLFDNHFFKNLINELDTINIGTVCLNSSSDSGNFQLYKNEQNILEILNCSELKTVAKFWIKQNNRLRFFDENEKKCENNIYNYKCSIKFIKEKLGLLSYKILKFNTYILRCYINNVKYNDNGFVTTDFNKNKIEYMDNKIHCNYLNHSNLHINFKEFEY